MLGEKENICNPSSSDNITKEVIFVNFVELLLFLCQLWNENYTAMERYSSSELCYVVYQKRTRPVLFIYVHHPIGIITLSMSTSYWSILFIFCLLCCTVVVLSSTLLLLQSSLLLHQNQNIREEKERYYAITNHIFASVCDRNILSMSNLMDIFSSTSWW